MIIKGTQVYDAQRGGFVDLSILDVLQIFGRAGRPQFDTYGEGIILTTHEKLQHYLTLLTEQVPIESKFVTRLDDHLNAEVSLGTVTNVAEAVAWLGDTYLYVRMRRNPMNYGISYAELAEDPLLEKRRHGLITATARRLDQTHMIRFDERTGLLWPTDLGRIASHFYIQFETVAMLNMHFRQFMTEADLLSIISHAKEFDSIKLRDEEVEELKKLHDRAPCQVDGGFESEHGKINVLLQSYISQSELRDFSLISDSAYVAQNASRLIRAMFEIALRKCWASTSIKLLAMAKGIDRRIWPFQHPLTQFGQLPFETVQKLEGRSADIETLRELRSTEIGELIHNAKQGMTVARLVERFPGLDIEATVFPITRSVLRINIRVTSLFIWDERLHGQSEPWWIWIEDPDSDFIYHSEYFLLHRRQSMETQELIFTIPVFEPIPTQYALRAISDRWLGAETLTPVSFKHLILPEHYASHTELLDLRPLPISVILEEGIRSLFQASFSHFNPVQTQVFHSVYHGDDNILLGAPTGSGKTIVAELSVMRLFRTNPQAKVIYVAPLKALVRERVLDWGSRFAPALRRRLVELTGDITPDLRSLESADIIVTTPEKWDGISRSWKHRRYVQRVGLLILDEIHLLGQERGAVLEVIVSRMNYIARSRDSSVRIVGLSTALANATDLAEWLGIPPKGLFNFRPSVRPVPLEIHIQGFSGTHYCPRMATMNKPAYLAIQSHSPAKPVLIFVSSRRQTRLTAQDLISFCAIEGRPRQYAHIPEDEMDMLVSQVSDPSLKFTLAFGIGLHHAGLSEHDRTMVEELFLNRKIQVLVATSTLAWGVNLPAHLVIVKGTEFYDAKVNRYVDFAITDIMQMIGRAGRPQFDDSAVACIFAQDSKKNFYKKFIYEPFPVESSLHKCLHDHINAEIASGVVKSLNDAVGFLSWTYLFRRLTRNPNYYGLTTATKSAVREHLIDLLQKVINDLQAAGCIRVDEAGNIESTNPGRIAAVYYLRYTTIANIQSSMTAGSTFVDLMHLLSDASEFDEFPVRHNEDLMNAELAQTVPLKADRHGFDSPHTKVFLLLQAHMSRVSLPVTDYLTDTKSVLEQCTRIIQVRVERKALAVC